VKLQIVALRADKNVAFSRVISALITVFIIRRSSKKVGAAKRRCGETNYATSIVRSELPELEGHAGVYPVHHILWYIIHI
jgi:hypothetical protein